jgi:hypothetical protein
MWKYNEIYEFWINLNYVQLICVVKDDNLWKLQAHFHNGDIIILDLCTSKKECMESMSNWMNL